MVCPGFNAILLRACSDVGCLAEALGEGAIADESRGFAGCGLAALDGLFSEARGRYLCRDRVTGVMIDSPSSGGLLAAFAAIPRQRAAALAATTMAQAARAPFVVASHDPADPRFDARRMIAEVFRRAGEVEAAEAIARSGLALIRESGFAEYYDPTDGKPLGGGRFTWTAAMVLEFLRGT